MPSTVVFFWLPALSLADSLAERLSPSPLTVVFAGQPPSRPESASAQVQPMTTSPSYQPLALGPFVAAPVSVGAVLSTSMSVTPSLAVLPAASAAVPLADWFAPSPSSWPGGHLSTPESTSAQAKPTMTLASYQPLAFGARSADALMMGGVLSRRRTNWSSAELPALSSAAPATGLLPSLEMTLSDVQLLMPEPPSSPQMKWTVVSALFQPFAFMAGVSECVIVGGVLSILTWTVLCCSSLPALSTVQNSSV